MIIYHIEEVEYSKTGLCAHPRFIIIIHSFWHTVRICLEEKKKSKASLQLHSA